MRILRGEATLFREIILPEIQSVEANLGPSLQTRRSACRRRHGLDLGRRLSAASSDIVDRSGDRHNARAVSRPFRDRRRWLGGSYRSHRAACARCGDPLRHSRSHHYRGTRPDRCANSIPARRPRRSRPRRRSCFAGHPHQYRGRHHAALAAALSRRRLYRTRIRQCRRYDRRGRALRLPLDQLRWRRDFLAEFNPLECCAAKPQPVADPPHRLSGQPAVRHRYSSGQRGADRHGTRTGRFP